MQIVINCCGDVGIASVESTGTLSSSMSVELQEQYANQIKQYQSDLAAGLIKEEVARPKPKRLNRKITDEQKLKEATMLVHDRIGLIKAIIQRVVFGGEATLDRGKPTERKVWIKGLNQSMDGATFQEVQANSLALLWRRLVPIVHTLTEVKPVVVKQTKWTDLQGEEHIERKRIEVEEGDNIKILRSMIKSCVRDTLRRPVTVGHDYGYESEEAESVAIRDDVYRRNKRVRPTAANATDIERRLLDPEDDRNLDLQESFIFVTDEETKLLVSQCIPPQLQEAATLLTAGTQSQVAKQLGISTATMERRVKAIKGSLGFVWSKSSFYDWLGGVLAECLTSRYCYYTPHTEYLVKSLGDVSYVVKMPDEVEVDPLEVESTVKNHGRLACKVKERRSLRYFTRWTEEDLKPIGIAVDHTNHWLDRKTSEGWWQDYATNELRRYEFESNPYLQITSALQEWLERSLHKPTELAWYTIATSQAHIKGHNRLDGDCFHCEQRTGLATLVYHGYGDKKDRFDSMGNLEVRAYHVHRNRTNPSPWKEACNVEYAGRKHRKYRSVRLNVNRNKSSHPTGFNLLQAIGKDRTLVLATASRKPSEVRVFSYGLPPKAPPVVEPKTMPMVIG